MLCFQMMMNVLGVLLRVTAMPSVSTHRAPSSVTVSQDSLEMDTHAEVSVTFGAMDKQ